MKHVLNPTISLVELEILLSELDLLGYVKYGLKPRSRSQVIWVELSLRKGKWYAGIKLEDRGVEQRWAKLLRILEKAKEHVTHPKEVKVP